MVPCFTILENGEFEQPDTQYFLVEKPGLDIACLIGAEDGDDDDDDLYA